MAISDYRDEPSLEASGDNVIWNFILEYNSNEAVVDSYPFKKNAATDSGSVGTTTAPLGYVKK